MSTALEVIQIAMGETGVLNYAEVARRTGDLPGRNGVPLQARTIRTAGEGTTVGNLRLIARALGRDLVIAMPSIESAGSGQAPEDKAGGAA